MDVSRRKVLQSGLGLGAAIGLGNALSGCGAVTARMVAPRRKVELPELKRSPEMAFLDRTSFGATDADLKRYRDEGKDAAIERLLAAKEEEPVALTAMLHKFDVLRMESVELFDLPKARVIDQLQAAAIVRATYSNNQLQERMVDFWSNHFNVFALKGDGAFYKGRQEQDGVRKHAMGNFRDLLAGVSESVSMITYLDSDRNEKGKPNENFAREILELHTLGVDGGYTQKDIQEVARCFSGWMVETRHLRPKGEFRFEIDRHDKGEKLVLGKKIPAGYGLEDVVGATDAHRDHPGGVYDILTAHPATARHLARKLVAWFAGGRDEELEASVAAAFLKSKGDIKATVRPILESDFLINGPPRVRRPFEFLVASLRRANVQTAGDGPLQEHLRSMGQAMYEWPMPDGYPIDARSWAGSMVPRWKFAHALASDAINGTHVHLADLTLPADFLSTAKPEVRLAAYLSAPEFQWI